MFLFLFQTQRQSQSHRQTPSIPVLKKQKHQSLEEQKLTDPTPLRNDLFENRIDTWNLTRRWR